MELSFDCCAPVCMLGSASSWESTPAFAALSMQMLATMLLPCSPPSYTPSTFSGLSNFPDPSSSVTFHLSYAWSQSNRVPSVPLRCCWVLTLQTLTRDPAFKLGRASGLFPQADPVSSPSNRCRLSGFKNLPNPLSTRIFHRCSASTHDSSVPCKPFRSGWALMLWMVTRAPSRRTCSVAPPPSAAEDACVVRCTPGFSTCDEGSPSGKCSKLDPRSIFLDSSSKTTFHLLSE
mmetsp:Transcript_17322/g.40231  ORF Transcript_17322/g.40231 Transcript_17322/m.40231 type:complete len:233 (-) Transcript_17322:541-1239(-)